EVRLGHQLRQLAAQAGLDLAAVLAQGRRDPRQAEPGVDLLLGPGDDPPAGLDVEQPVLGELEPGAYRHLAGADVVLLRAGEVLQRGAPGVRRYHPQVDLQALGGPYRGLGVAARDDLDHVRQPRERGHERAGVVRGGQDVDVADRLAHAAQRAGVGTAPAAGHAGQLGDDLLGQVQGRVEVYPAAGLLEELDAVQDV